jgi:peptidoglycan/xylan/chitin deacetylase (PgdA/CDA1 family)
MPLIALKVDVDTYRGTREGVPNLLRLLKKHQANATFLFSLGPDHTGRAMKRALRPGFFGKVSRTSVVEHYGLKTLMYGVLLPGPDIGKSAAAEMRSTRDAGFECGIHTWDHVAWQDNVRKRDAAWTKKTMQLSFDRYVEIFGEAPTTHGAAGWQMNEHAFEAEDGFGFAYASDSRAMLTESGSLANPSAGPHRLSANGKLLSCIQMPTTLPTLDEMLGRRIEGVLVDTGNIAQAMLRLTEPRRDHVYTLHAELEGQKLAPVLEALLEGWRSQGYQCVSMAEYYQKIGREPVPACRIEWGELPGRSGELIVQPT